MEFDFNFVLLISSVNMHGLYLWTKRKSKSVKIIMVVNETIIHYFGCKRNIIRVGKGDELYDRSMKWWLSKYDTENYPTNYEGKFVAQRFMKTLNNKIYKYMTSISKYIIHSNNLNVILIKYNNACHGTMKMKPHDVKTSTCFDFETASYDEDSKI